MGLFSLKKKIFVSSVVYNLAGDINDRPNFLKTSVLSGVISNGKASIGETVTQNYLRGPGIKLRAFARWCRNSGYNDLVGMGDSNLVLLADVDHAAIISQIPHGSNETVMLQTAEIGAPDYGYWVDKYMVANHPNILESEYEADFDEQTQVVTVTFADLHVETFTLTGYNPISKYLYITYSLTQAPTEGPIITGTTVILGSGDPFPSTSGWTLMSTTGTVSVYQRTDYAGWDPVNSQIKSVRKTMFQDNGTVRSYRIDTQDLVSKTYTPLQVLIYERGSGNPVLDAQFAVDMNAGDFLPYIPLRVKNNFVSDTFMADVYPLAKKAFKKSMDASFDEVIDKIADNESLGDIDYAYAVFGVSFNTKENTGRRYIYEFFQEAMLGQDLSNGAFTAWLIQWEDAQEKVQAWNDWFYGQGNPANPLFNTPEPERAAYVAPPLSSVRVSSDNRPDFNYDITISWNGIDEEIGSGLKKPDAKVGDLWFEVLGSDEYIQSAYVDGINPSQEYPSFIIGRARLNWQVTANTWRSMTIYGLNHRNLIYGGKAVETNAGEALEDAEESGFIVPLHEEIFKRMPLKDATQMSTACCYLMFNCYKVVKQKWYQTFVFKIFIVIIVIVITVYTGGAGAGSAGLLGTNAAVGAAIGFTGTAAIIAGAIANAVAAIIVTQIITSAATAAFGDKIGSIVGAIAAIIAIQAGSAMSSGSTASASFGQMLRAENLIKLSIAAGNGYSDYLKADAMETVQKTQELMKDYADQAQEISKQYEDVLGYGEAYFDPMQLTDISKFSVESLDSFLERTLMTGSDIASLSLDMLSRFTDITLSTDLQ